MKIYKRVSKRQSVLKHSYNLLIFSDKNKIYFSDEQDSAIDLVYTA